jgi:DNA mismatch repair protein MutS2
MFNFQKTRESALINAQREAKRLIKDAKDEADEILKNMRDLERLGYSSDARQKLEEERKRLKARLENVEDNINKTQNEDGEELKNVKEGQEVFLPSLNQKVVVLTKPDNKGEVQVQAGIMKISVKVKDLRASKLTHQEKKEIKKREVNLNLKSVSSSVDLRGMDSEEAVYTTDKYLDDAYRGGLAEVTIVHGKGTGVLRQAINDMLRRHAHVKSYRLGNYGEGGTGVTMVELK